MGKKRKERRAGQSAPPAPLLPLASTIETSGTPASPVDTSVEERPSVVPAMAGEGNGAGDRHVSEDESEERKGIDEGERTKGEFQEPEKKESNMTNETATPTSLIEENISTVLADDLEITGTMKFKSSVKIMGVFEGEIISEGLLIVEAAAKVTAAITTKNLISRGEITGDVTASEQVILKETAVHTGDITTPNIILDRGSVFNGSCIMKRSG